MFAGLPIAQFPCLIGWILRNTRADQATRSPGIHLHEKKHGGREAEEKEGFQRGTSTLQRVTFVRCRGKSLSFSLRKASWAKSDLGGILCGDDDPNFRLAGPPRNCCLRKMQFPLKHSPHSSGAVSSPCVGSLLTVKRSGPIPNGRSGSEGIAQPESVRPK